MEATWHDLLDEARDAFGTAMFDDANDSYLRAGERMVSNNDFDAWSMLIDEHIQQFHAAGLAELARSACDHYSHTVTRLASALPNRASLGAHLTMLRAASAALLLDWSRCESLLAEITENSIGSPSYDSAMMMRLRGLIANDHHETTVAQKYLHAARSEFEAAGFVPGVALVDRDLRLIGVAEGDDATIQEMLSQTKFVTAGERIGLALAFRRNRQYEHAVEVLEGADRPDLEPATRFQVLYHLAFTHKLLRDYRAVEDMLPLMRDICSLLPDPAASSAALERLSETSAPRNAAPGSDDPIDNLGVLHLIRSDVGRARSITEPIELQHNLLALVERLQTVEERPVSRRVRAYVDLLWAEVAVVALDAGQHSWFDEGKRRALAALNSSRDGNLHELASAALRVLGNLDIAVGAFDVGYARWEQAFSDDEQIAAALLTDERRIDFLAATPDAFDATIENTYRRASATGAAGDYAACAVAIEAARGAAILASTSDNSAAELRALPSSNDPKACTDWMTSTANLLDKDQGVWMMHLHPSAIFHVVLARNLLELWVAPADPQHLLHLTRELMLDRDENRIEAAAATDDENWTRSLRQVAGELAYEQLLARLPDHVQRLSIVAGGALGDVPFCALPLGSDPFGLVRRFSLSELPCLSASTSLRRQAHARRGQAILRITHGIASGESQITENGRLTMAVPTVPAVRTQLESNQWQICRLHCHGAFTRSDALRSYLVLAPGPTAEDTGYLDARDLAKFRLGNVGVLTLGACESGMSQLRGRDETQGFVRAAFLAGCATVLVAKFKARQGPADRILAEFEDRLAYEPKDVALQSAILCYLDSCEQAPELVSVPNPQHWLRWACWSLHGDPGLQTSAGRLARRRIRKRHVLEGASR